MADPILCRNEDCTTETGGPAICEPCHDAMLKTWVTQQEEEHNLPTLEEDAVEFIVK